MQILLLGTAAGFASALLFASILSGTLFALALCILSPLPIMIVGMGWVHRAGLSAALVATAIVAALDPLFGLAFAITTAAPAWALAYLGMLGRREGSAVVEWYPIGHIVAIAAIMGAVIGILSAYSISTSYEAYSAGIEDGVEGLLRALTDTPAGAPLAIPDVEDPSAIVSLIVFFLPLLSAATWLLTTLFNLWLAARVLKMSGRFARPWPDLPSIRLPRWLLPVALGLFVLSALPGMTGLAARIAGSSLVTPFTISGYAALHALTRGASGRTAILGSVYVMTFILNWIALLAMTLFGIVEHLLDLRGRVAPKGSGGKR